MHVHRGLRLSRRTVLRGIGAAVALPVLDAMTPAFGAPPEAALRFVVVYMPNGMHMPDWRPPAEGAAFPLPHLLEPFAPLREHVAVFSGLAADGARAHGDGPGDHARAAGAFLTGTHPRKTAGADLRAGISVDQVAARKLGETTALRSLEIGAEAGRPSGECDSGYSCAYSNNLAWASATTPLPKETDPREVFDRLFGGARLPPAERERRRAARRSVLDFALEDARRLAADLGAADRRKLDEYLDAVRALEVRVARGAGESDAAAADADAVRPAGAPADLREHVRLLYDLVLAALRTDRTRVVTFMLGNEGSNRSYRFLGVPEGHHELSHHGGDAAKQAKIRTIGRFHAGEFAAFLGRLHAVREDDATLLGRSLVLFGSGIADGNAHDHHDLPVLVAGGAGGFRGGVHLRSRQETPVANLYLSLLDRLGVRASSFGDATGRLAGV